MKEIHDPFSGCLSFTTCLESHDSLQLPADTFSPAGSFEVHPVWTFSTSSKGEVTTKVLASSLQFAI